MFPSKGRFRMIMSERVAVYTWLHTCLHLQSTTCAAFDDQSTPFKDIRFCSAGHSRSDAEGASRVGDVG